MSSAPTVSLRPDQAKALVGLFNETDAFALDIGDADHDSLRVVTYATLDDDSGLEPDGGEGFRVRFFTVSVAGTIREQSPLPTEQAA